MKTICFSNHGTIDPRLITTLGVNVKQGDSPVGYFGTGLKYAIAVLLREGQKIEIVSGGKCYAFSVKPDTIRGKSFGFITMRQGRTETPLGFTTDLGKNWTLQHAYRELYCNALDELGGKVEAVSKYEPALDCTSIFVTGQKFFDVHNRCWDFLLNPQRKSLWPSAEVEVEVYLGESKYLFYRGIAAYELPSPSLFTYNILAQQELTEDRTLKSLWGAEYDITKYIASHKDTHFLETVLSAPKGTFEQGLNFTAASWNCDDTFYTAVQQVSKKKPLDLNSSAFACLLKAKKDGPADYTIIDLTNAEEDILEDAIAFCKAIGFPVSDFPITIVESTGKDTLGLARHGKSLIAHEVLKQPDLLRLILIEEYVHLRDKVSDCTRDMQNVLFREIVRLGIEVLAHHE